MLVSAGGVLGSLLRYLLDLFFVANRPGITTANILGSALAAHILVLMERRGITWARYFLLPGFCGGLTTFSGVTFEAMRHPHENWIFLTVNTFGSLTAVAIVLPLSRKLIKEKA